MKGDIAKFSFQAIQRIKRLKILSIRRYGENGGGGMFAFKILSVHVAARGGNLCFHDENCQHAHQNQLNQR